MTNQELHSQIQAICKDLNNFTGYKLIFNESYCAITKETKKRFSLSIEVLYAKDEELMFHGMTGITETGVLKELERKVQERNQDVLQQRIIQELEHAGSL